MKSRLKRWVKACLHRNGLHLYTNGSLPRGVSVYQDVQSILGQLQVRVVFDVGANVGQTSMEVARQIPNATIYAFEPFRATFEKLVENTRCHKQVRPYQLALGGENGSCTVKGVPESVFNSLNSLECEDSARLVEETIRVESLDSFCESHGLDEIDLLKTDTEGFDLEVLKGACSLLRAGRIRAVFCEVAFDKANRQNTRFEPVYDFLVAHGFRFYGLYNTYHFQTNPAPLAYCDALFCRSQV